jgi:hypothetical protein
MSRIIIRGVAAVFRYDEQITDPGVLRSLGELVYDDEALTDFLGYSPEEDELAAALEPGGFLRFTYHDGDDRLTITTTYLSRRPLTDAELRWLVDFTMGQWADGIGENWAWASLERYGYLIMCLTSRNDVGPNYPAVEIVAG